MVSLLDRTVYRYKTDSWFSSCSLAIVRSNLYKQPVSSCSSQLLTSLARFIHLSLSSGWKPLTRWTLHFLLYFILHVEPRGSFLRLNCLFSALLSSSPIHLKPIISPFLLPRYVLFLSLSPRAISFVHPPSLFTPHDSREIRRSPILPTSSLLLARAEIFFSVY